MSESDEKNESKPEAPIDFDFSHLGGTKVGHPIPVQTDKEIDFSHLGGKCVLRASDHPLFDAKPAESVESEEPEESQDAMLREEDEAL
jgi:hypothetical protein